MGTRGLIVVILGVLLLITAGYWLRPAQNKAEPARVSEDNSASSAAPDMTPEPVAGPATELSPKSDLDASGIVGQTNVFRTDTPPLLLADIADFDKLRSARSSAAAQRIVARGVGEMPAILAALDDVVSNGGTLAQQNHLMLVAAQIGDASYADELIAIASRIDPGNILSGSIYDVLDIIGAENKADDLAIRIIADPNSREMQLLTALNRYWHSTPSDVATQALQHLDSDVLLIRSSVYRVALNGGLQVQIYDQLVEDVAVMEYAAAGNISVLNVLAEIDPAEKYLPRIEGLRLLSHIRDGAILMNRFSFATDEQKESMMPAMFGSDVSELKSKAIAFMLVNSRGDLLQEFRLAAISADPFAQYENVIPDFVNMPREKRALYLGDERLSELEAAAAEPRKVRLTAHAQKVANRLGYRVTTNGSTILIEEDG